MVLCGAVRFLFKSIVAYDFNALTLIPVPSVKFYCEKWMGWKDDKIRFRAFENSNENKKEVKQRGRHFNLHNLKYKVQNQ